MHEAEVEGIGVGIGDDGPGAPAIILRVDDRVLPIFVGPGQSHSIQLALEGIPFERPLTHDLLVEMVTDIGGAIDRIRIDDLSDGTFYAKVDVERFRDSEREKFVFDARPSDGIAIAVRVQCPIEVAEAVVEEAGIDPDDIVTDEDVDPDDFDPSDEFE